MGQALLEQTRHDCLYEQFALCLVGGLGQDVGIGRQDKGQYPHQFGFGSAEQAVNQCMFLVFGHQQRSQQNKCLGAMVLRCSWMSI